MPDYLKTSEVCGLLRYGKKTLYAKIGRGTFRQGVHFDRPPGSQLRWRRDALLAWVRGELADDDVIPLAGPSIRRVA